MIASLYKIPEQRKLETFFIEKVLAFDPFPNIAAVWILFARQEHVCLT